MDPLPPQRASDADRERATTVLRDAGADGRLTLEELGERTEAAHRAVTLDELASLTADLVGSPAMTTTQAASPPADERRVNRSMLSSHRYPVRGVLRSGTTYATTLGSLQIDLREARLEDDAVELALRTVLGSIEVLVPVGVAVELDGGGTMCSVDLKLAAPPPDGAPVVRLRCSGALGSVTVRSRQRVGEQLKQAARRFFDDVTR